MDAPNGAAHQAEPDYPSRSRCAGDLLRGLCTMGGIDGADPKIWDNGEIADRLSDAVAVSFYRPFRDFFLVAEVFGTDQLIAASRSNSQFDENLIPVRSLQDCQ